MEGTESKRRNRSVEETVAAWQEMLKGSAVGTQHCLRFKMDMQAPNKALRDPVAYRCNPTPHWRTGHKYKVHPSVTFCQTALTSGNFAGWSHHLVNGVQVSAACRCRCRICCTLPAGCSHITV